MELLTHKRALAVYMSLWLLFSVTVSVEGLKGSSKLIQEWIQPSDLFHRIRNNGDMLDGTEMLLQRYVLAENGGGSNVSVTIDIPSAWGTFRLWRGSDTEFHLCSLEGQFLRREDQEGSMSAIAGAAATNNETFYIERLDNSSRVRIKLQNGTYLQALTENQLTAVFLGTLGWHDSTATFEMPIVSNDLHRDFLLANVQGYAKAKEVLSHSTSHFQYTFNESVFPIEMQGHRNSFNPELSTSPQRRVHSVIRFLDFIFSVTYLVMLQASVVVCTDDYKQEWSKMYFIHLS